MVAMMAWAQPTCHEDPWTPMATTQMRPGLGIVKALIMDVAQALPVMQACSASQSTQVLLQNATLELKSMAEIATSTPEE